MAENGQNRDIFAVLRLISREMGKFVAIFLIKSKFPKIFISAPTPK